MLPLQYFKEHIRSQGLFAEGEKILLAVSGGKDSVLMAHLFKQSGYNFGIAHCNFTLRADESTRDEHFVRMMAGTLEVPVYVTQFQTKAYASQRKISTQMAARELRYHWFEEIRAANGYDYIALAQHQDDAIETVLLNLTRGTGIAGLHGILPKQGRLIRPLLFLSRSDIDSLVAEHEFTYVEDSSNLSSNYARNKIRHHVLPYLKEINPNLENTFQQNIRRFAETEMVLQNAVSALRSGLFQRKGSSWHLPLAGIRALQPAQLLLFELLKPYGFSEQVVSELLHALDKQSGTSFYSATHRIVVDRENLILDLRGEKDQELIFVHPQQESADAFGQQLRMVHVKVPFFERNSQKAFIDSRLLIYPLVIRAWQAGDKFRPLGMGRFKKLSDFFIDEKIPVNEKDKVALLINGNGEIIWLAGLRQDDRYKVTGSTKEMLIVEITTPEQISH